MTIIDEIGISPKELLTPWVYRVVDPADAAMRRREAKLLLPTQSRRLA